MKIIAHMKTASALLPDNIDTAATLLIEESCQVCDVYPLITDRKNISNVIVNGMEYTSQQIRNMVLNERLGGGHGLDRVNTLTTALDIPIPDQEPARPIPGEGVPMPPHPEPAPVIDWGRPEAPRRAAITTDATYDRYMELLRQNNPQFRQFGDVPRVQTAAELAALRHDREYLGIAPEAPGQVLQRAGDPMVIFDEYTYGAATTIW